MAEIINLDEYRKKKAPKAQEYFCEDFTLVIRDSDSTENKEHDRELIKKIEKVKNSFDNINKALSDLNKLYDSLKKK